MVNLSDAEKKMVDDVARWLDVPVRWLYELVSAESSWDPSAKNPNSSARGLIQITDQSARDLGYSSSLDLVAKNPTISDQMAGPVYQYLRRYAPFTNNSEFFMAVFLPAYRKLPYSTSFSESVTANNWGISTPAHYVAFVLGKLSEFKSGLISVDDLIENNTGYDGDDAGDAIEFDPVVITPDSGEKKIAVSIVLTVAAALLYYYLRFRKKYQS